jgi:beta-mannanase
MLLDQFLRIFIYLQDPAVFKTIWMNMFNYFTYTKNLHNILWIYSPDQSAPDLTMYYPGGDYVDIVGLDVYIDDPVRRVITLINKIFIV